MNPNQSPELIKHYRNKILESLQLRGISISDLEKGVKFKEAPHIKIELIGKDRGSLRINVDYEEFYNKAKKFPESFEIGSYFFHASINYEYDGHAWGRIWYFNINKIDRKYYCSNTRYLGEGIKDNPKFAEEIIKIGDKVIQLIQGQKKFPKPMILLDSKTNRIL